MSLCRESEESGGFGLKGGFLVEFLCEYSGGVDVCAFVAYLFVWVAQEGKAAATKIESGGLLWSVCRVKVQFALAA